MNIYLDDSSCSEQLFPFTCTRHVADIRVGIMTIREKWEQLSGVTVYTSLEDHPGNALQINANVIPAASNYADLLQLLTAGGDPTTAGAKVLEHPWQIFQYNDWALREDFALLTNGRVSQPIHSSNKLTCPENIFIEEGAVVEHSFLNAAAGPIYIAKNALVMEGNMIRGPFALGEGSVLKMGSKVYGATSIGLYCVAGGEIKNTLMFGYSNKAHDGYLGDSVIGEWCNLGAGTSNSNVKNTGGQVKYRLGPDSEPIAAGNKAGLLMGDYSRAAINSSFNTGSVVGVCCNIFGDPFPAKYIASFSWGSERYKFEKALTDIDNWKKMKGQRLSEAEKQLLFKLYTSTQ